MSNMNMNTGNPTNTSSGGEPTAPATVLRSTPLYVPPHRRAEQVSVPLRAAPAPNPPEAFFPTTKYMPPALHASGRLPWRIASGTPQFAPGLYELPYHCPPSARRQSAPSPQVTPQHPCAPVTVDERVFGPKYYPPTHPEYAQKLMELREASVLQDPDRRAPRAQYYYPYPPSPSGQYGGFSHPPFASAPRDLATSPKFLCLQPGCTDRVQLVDNIDEHMRAAHGIRRF